LIARVLLDENMAHALRLALSQFDPATVRYMGWAGLKNGDLLAAAEAAGFDVLLTGDKAMAFQQNLRNRKIAVVSLTAPHWRLVQNHIRQIVLAIETAEPGSFTKVQVGTFVRPKKSRRGPTLG
jgi:hypothetical protein